MKQLIVLLLSCYLWSACTKGNKNGDLDGMWQLHQLEYADGRIEKPLDHYLNVELDFLYFQEPTGNLLGKFQYSGDSLKIRMLEGTDTSLESFGINSLNENFGITVSSSKMILKTGYSTGYYRKW